MPTQKLVYEYLPNGHQLMSGQMKHNVTIQGNII